MFRSNEGVKIVSRLKIAGGLGCVVVATAEIRGFQKLRAFLMSSFFIPFFLSRADSFYATVKF